MGYEELLLVVSGVDEGDGVFLQVTVGLVGDGGPVVVRTDVEMVGAQAARPVRVPEMAT